MERARLASAGRGCLRADRGTSSWSSSCSSSVHRRSEQAEGEPQAALRMPLEPVRRRPGRFGTLRSSPPQRYSCPSRPRRRVSRAATRLSRRTQSGAPGEIGSKRGGRRGTPASLLLSPSTPHLSLAPTALRTHSISMQAQRGHLDRDNGDLEVGVADLLKQRSAAHHSAPIPAPPTWLVNWERKRPALLMECIAECIGVFFCASRPLSSSLSSPFPHLSFLLSPLASCLRKRLELTHRTARRRFLWYRRIGGVPRHDCGQRARLRLPPHHRVGLRLRHRLCVLSLASDTLCID